ncbi:MAG: integrase [Alteromonadaceae bacterium]|nr:MAG: integrase [Alteromonadaceae bacterium]
MNPKRVPPTPILNNLESIGDPFKRKDFSTAAFFSHGKPPKGSQIDYEYTLKFLYSYNGSSATFNAYRREIERFLQWCWRIEGRSLLLMRREDIEDYIRFCISPPQAWIGTKSTPRFLTVNDKLVVNDEWRPFVVKVRKERFREGISPEKKDHLLSQSAMKAIFTALSSFYDYLTQEQLLDANPVSLIRQKSKFLIKTQNIDVVRRVSNLQWEYVIDTTERMANEDPEKHERTLFIMNCLYAMYLRISELVDDERSTPIMSDFKRDHANHWWFYVTGKGNKSRKIAVCDEMIEALKRYRKSRGLTLLPTPNDQSPLLPKFKGKGAITSTRQIRDIVQYCFDTTFERMKEDGLEEDASDLRTATVHWLRHTGISEDVKIRPREHVRDDAGHNSMQTTDRYIESDEHERHASGKAKPIKETF